MNNGVLFQDLVSPYMPKEHGRVKDWDYVILDKYDNTRLYYKKLSSEQKEGFTFALLDFDSCGFGFDDIWKSEDLQVSVSAHGYGHWDGLRHLFFKNDVNSQSPGGYWYYPNTSIGIEFFIQLKELEKTYCMQSSSIDK